MPIGWFLPLTNYLFILSHSNHKHTPWLVQAIRSLEVVPNCRFQVFHPKFLKLFGGFIYIEFSIIIFSYFALDETDKKYDFFLKMRQPYKTNVIYESYLFFC